MIFRLSGETAPALYICRPAAVLLKPFSFCIQYEPWLPAILPAAYKTRSPGQNFVADVEETG